MFLSTLFSHLDETQIGEVIRLCPDSRVQCGQTLWRTGDQTAHFFFVKCGHVALQIDKAILDVFGRGDLLGEFGMEHANTATVLTAGRVVQIPRELLLEQCETHAVFSGKMLEKACKQSRRFQACTQRLISGQVEQRLARTLLHLGMHHGVLCGGPTMIPIRLSRGQLGVMVNARPESVIRLMTEWERQGILRTAREGITLYQPERLAALAKG